MATPAVLGMLLVGLYWLILGPGRRYRWLVLVLLGLLGLVITTTSVCAAGGSGPAGFSFAVAASVCLGWLGYKVWRRGPPPSSAELPVATLPVPAPSARSLHPEDVAGSWCFYVDSAASTVTVDFQADGNYTETIVDNCGERIECPGGRWKLDGAHVELTSYRSTSRAVIERVRWFFGDWQKELVLFATDASEAEPPLLGLRRGAVPLEQSEPYRQASGV